MTADQEGEARGRIPNDGIGKRVMQSRNKRRLNKTQLGRAVGVDQTTIGRLETEKTEQVSLSLLEKIASHLKVPLELLRSGAGEEIEQNRRLVLEPSVYRRETREKREGAVDEVLSTFYPREYAAELSSAKQLWITGTNLRRIATD